MDDATPAPKSCSVCDDPIRSDNTVGICTNRDKPECFNAYARQARKNRLANPAAARECRICGRPLSRNNQTGLCDGSKNPACKSARNAGRSATRKPRVIPASERPACAVCGSKLRADNKVGVCGKTPECREEMAERRRIAARKTDPAAPREHPRRVPAIPAGTVFGRLVTLEESPKGDGKVRCRCECGTECLILVSNLKSGLTRSCGCLRRESAGRPRGPGGIYLPAGSVSGRLATLEDAVKSHHRVRTRCECGAETVKLAQRIKLGLATSCGSCVPREGGRTHGLSGHPLYSIWRGIAGRAGNPGNRDYENYGAIGRTICEGYRTAPDGLLRFAADMGPRPGPEYSTDRLDNDGGYWCGRCPECVRNGWPFNVAWRTREQQQNNLSVSVKATARRIAVAAEERRSAKLPASRNRKPLAPAQDALF
jgi:hypothetical protein